MNRLKWPGDGHHQIIFLFGGISLAGFSLLRTILLMSAWPEIEHSVTNLIYIYGVGFFI